MGIKQLLKSGGGMTNKRLNPFSKIIQNKTFLKPLENPINEFPFYIDTEITNHCNLECIMCRRQVMTREKGYMAEGIYKKLIDEMSMYNVGLKLGRMGEPTMHKQITEFIEYANECNVTNFLSTNGFYSKEKMGRILKAGPDIIRFSFQGLNKEEFEKIRKPSKYEVVTDNIAFCVKERERHGWEKPYLVISTTVLDESKEEIEAFKEEWLKIVDRVEVGKTTFSMSGNNGEYEDFKKRATVNTEYLPCLEILTKISVNWNGDIIACCSDYCGAMILGNLKDITIKEAWECTKEVHFRQMVSYNMRHSELPVCKDCFKGDYKFKDNPVE
jgi:radical SAM protein with 4Fe4S-binding SPASM domain